MYKEILWFILGGLVLGVGSGLLATHLDRRLFVRKLQVNPQGGLVVCSGELIQFGEPEVLKHLPAAIFGSPKLPAYFRRIAVDDVTFWQPIPGPDPEKQDEDGAIKSRETAYRLGDMVKALVDTRANTDEGMPFGMVLTDEAITRLIAKLKA